MNQLLANSAIILLFATAVFQSGYVLLYRRQMRKSDAPGESYYKPKTAIVLCLRGVDPGLEACLAGIFKQAYDNFELHVVMDHESDPCRAVVTDFLENRGDQRVQAHVHTLDEIDRKGSLKCQSLVHAIEYFREDIEVVALVDADAIVTQQWLAQLVGPLADSTIGATTGNRWFTPPDDRLGSWVREIWNAAAIVQMQLYEIAWGGSLAIKMSVFDETDLLTRWQSAFCEDTLISSELQQDGLNVHRVNSVIVNNCESTSLPSAIDWITRQLLTVRLYHRYWPCVFGHAVAVGLCVFVVPASVLSLVLAGLPKLAFSVLIAWLAYQVVNGLLLAAIRVPNQKILADDKQRIKIKPWKYAWALLGAQAVQPVAACRAMFARTVRWRGVEYRIENDSSVSVTDYRPYRHAQQRADESI